MRDIQNLALDIPHFRPIYSIPIPTAPFSHRKPARLPPESLVLPFPHLPQSTISVCSRRSLPLYLDCGTDSSIFVLSQRGPPPFSACPILCKSVSVYALKNPTFSDRECRGFRRIPCKMRSSDLYGYECLTYDNAMCL